MIRNVFCKTKDGYNSHIASGDIVESDIVFIEDSQEIITKNTVFSNGKALDIVSRTVTSDANGMIIIEDVDGYSFLNAVAYNNGQPLNVIRFGDNLYIGYYGGASTPSSSAVVDLLFTVIANVETTVYYIKNL